MVYHRRRSASTASGSRYRKAAGKKGSTALTTRLARLEKKVKPMVANWKYVYYPDQQMSSSIYSASPFTLTMNILPTGLTETNQRVGDLIRFNYLDLNLHLFRTLSSLSGASDCVRVLIVREKTALGSALSLNQLFNSATPTPRDTFNVTTRDHHRYEVYYDKTVLIGPNVSSVAASTLSYNQASPMECFLHISIPFHFVTDYSRGTSGSVSDIDTNSLTLVILNDSGTASDLVAYGSFTLKFLDA